MRCILLHSIAFSLFCFLSFVDERQAVVFCFYEVSVYALDVMCGRGIEADPDVLFFFCMWQLNSADSTCGGPACV